MTFLNFALVFGAAAFSIPLLIHLFNRSRFKVVQWGAMHLLETVLRQNRKRMKIEQLILLLIRISIPIILALCMARPVITGMKSLMGDVKTSVVVLLDNSYSMEAGGKSNSNFIKAKEATKEIVENLKRGSETSVILMGGGVSPLIDEPTVDTTRIAKDVSALDAGFGAAAAADAIDQGVGTAAVMHQVTREIVVVSDFQKVSWGESEGPALARAAELIQKATIKPRVTFYHVGKELKDNISIESLDFSRFVLGVGQKFQVRAHLRNFGDTSHPNLRVYFKVDGAERNASELALGPKEQGQILFSCVFEKAGSHVIEVAVDAEDDLKADNSYMASIPVWDKLPVLLVNGAPSPEPFKNETDFLEFALTPFGAAKSQLADMIGTTVIEPHQLNDKSLTDVRVVILANVPQLNDQQIKALEDFVREGGGLFIFPGTRINVPWYNSRLIDGGKGLLPLKLTAVAGSLEEGGAHTAIVAQHFEHPALELFNDPRNGNLSDAEIRSWYKLETLSDNVAAASETTVLARLDSGDPLFVEKKFGEGRIIQSAIPCNADWTNLPMRPFYLPMMQQLTTYLASKVFPPRNISVGRQLVAFLPPTVAGQKALLTDPTGKQHELPTVGKGSRSIVKFDQTQRPGLYILQAPDKDRTLTHFVVNTDRKESDLAQLTDKEIKEVAKPMGASVVRSWDEYKQLDRSRRFGRELWRSMLWTVLVLLFAELFLEQLFSRRRA